MCAVSGCTIRIQTDENDIYLCAGKDTHNHEANPELIQTTRLRQQIKQRVVDELIPINMIYEQEIAKASLYLICSSSSFNFSRFIWLKKLCLCINSSHEIN